MEDLFETGIFVAPEEPRLASGAWPNGDDMASTNDLLLSTSADLSDQGPHEGMEDRWVSKILIVDDHPENLLALEATLSHSRAVPGSEHHALEFVRASNGREALRKVLEETFAVILLDVQMPEMDGYETAELIRKRSKSQHTPIIFLTAVNTSDLNVFQGYSLGAVDYITKPFNPTILRAKVGVFVELYLRQLKIEKLAEHLRRQAIMLQTSNDELGMINRKLEGLYHEIEMKSDELTKERDFVDKILETAGSYIIIFDSDGRIERFNNASEKVSGLTKQSAKGRLAWETLVTESDALKVKETFTQLREGESISFEMSIVPMFQEHPRRVVMSFTGLYNEAHQLINVIASGIDISERYEAEEKIRRLNEGLERRVRERTLQLESTNQDLWKAKESAERANQTKDQFLAILSHELRTPLTPVLAVVQMMREDESIAPEWKEHIETIGRNVQLEARLIDDLLDLTRIANGKLELYSKQMDLHTIVQDTLRICQEEIHAKGLQLDLELKAGTSTVFADEARMQQILWNLIKNSVKFTPKGGRITIHTSNGNDGTILCQIRDTGIGIPREQLQTIFNAFEQGERAITRRFGGIGLGLAITKALVEQHHGTIRADSEGPDQGSTITIELPTESVTTPRANRERNDSQANANLKGLLLLVEDNEDTSRALKVLFEKKGFQVSVARSVKSAVEMIANRSFDLILSDIGLPDGEGYEVIRAANAIRPTHGIAISGYGMDGDRRRSMEAGFDAHLVKPLNFDELTATVKKLVSTTNESQPQ